MSAAVEAKARRLLGDGHVAILEAVDGTASALVQGDHGGYIVAHDSAGQWACECVAWQMHVTCSHVTAVRRIVTPTKTGAR